MRQSGHLENELLIRALDDELSLAERSAIDSHLASCDECSKRYREFGLTSVRLDALLTAIPVQPAEEPRRVLENELIRRESIVAHAANRRPWWQSASMVTALAASLAVSILVLPRAHRKETNRAVLPVLESAPATFEADGEVFVSLPYSNADLPMNTHHVVRMKVPVSSLFDAGVIFEPISTEAASSDRSVLADVLLGMDGEPLGVHVVSTESAN